MALEISNSALLRIISWRLKIIRFLDEKEPCESTEMYLLCTGRLIVRLSSLIHNGRQENSEERAMILDLYKPKNGWNYIYYKDMQKITCK